MVERPLATGEQINGEKVVINPARIEAVILRSVEAYQSGKDIFSQEVIPPERAFIQAAKKYEQEESSEDFALNSLFFLMMNLFADNSTAQLRRVSRPSFFQRYAWLFKPEEVIKRPKEEILTAASEYLAPGLNKTALDGWQHNAQVLVERYQGSIRSFFAEHNGDAPTILEALMGPKRKNNYPGLRRFGQKLGSLFLIWVHEYKLAELKKISDLGIPVDFQVVRIMVQTGGVDLPEGVVHKHHVVNKLVPALTSVCRKIEQERGISPAIVSKSLWFIGHLCCNNYEHQACPINQMCSRLISRGPLDEKGLVDPSDVGRFKTRRAVLAEKRRRRQIVAGQKELSLF